MKIFPAKVVRSIDEYTIHNEPIDSIDLMERAALMLTSWYTRKYKIDQEVVILAGPGSNGGDALAMARLLAERQYRIRCWLINGGKKLSKDCQVNLDRLRKQEIVQISEISKIDELPVFEEDSIVVDGLFGSGLTRPLEGLFAEVIKKINGNSLQVVSIDMPSGLFGEDNAGNNTEAIIRASYTLTFQFPFLSFFFRENYCYTGEWKVLNIKLHPEKISETAASYSTTELAFLQTLITPRDKFSHKGTYGHALIISGKVGMMGAALLTGRAALRGGAGLVTLHIPKSGYDIVQTAIPEAIVSIDQSEILFSSAPELDKYQAVAAGPGLGTKPNTAKGIAELLKNCKVPLVLDADALNIIASEKSFIDLLPEETILTPHPAEFDRLARSSAGGYARHIKQIEFSQKYKVIVVLKGAYTGISFPDGTYRFNTNGNPGMATGGSGDVLTGIIVSLLAKGYRPEEAAVAGVFLHGMAGDLAAEKMDQEAMIAGDIIDNIGPAFKLIKSRPFIHEGRGGEAVQ